MMEDASSQIMNAANTHTPLATNAFKAIDKKVYSQGHSQGQLLKKTTTGK